MNITPELLAAAERYQHCGNFPPAMNPYHRNNDFDRNTLDCDMRSLAAWAAHALPKHAEIDRAAREVRSEFTRPVATWSEVTRATVRLLDIIEGE